MLRSLARPALMFVLLAAGHTIENFTRLENFGETNVLGSR